MVYLDLTLRDIQCAQQPFVIGRRGTAGVLAVRFDYSAWVQAYGKGVITLLIKPYGQSAAYPVVLEQTGTLAVWEVSISDTQTTGVGQAELLFHPNNSSIDKSAVFGVAVLPDIGRPLSELPDAYEDWVARLEQLGAEAQQGAGSAENAEAWAVGEKDGVPVPETDETYHNNARYYAEEAEKNAPFVGEYGVTTLDELDAAYEAGRAMYIVDFMDVYSLTQTTFFSDSGHFIDLRRGYIFSRLEGGELKTCTCEAEWQRKSFDFLTPATEAAESAAYSAAEARGAIKHENLIDNLLYPYCAEDEQTLRPKIGDKYLTKFNAVLSAAKHGFKLQLEKQLLFGLGWTSYNSELPLCGLKPGGTYTLSFDAEARLFAPGEKEAYLNIYLAFGDSSTTPIAVSKMSRDVSSVVEPVLTFAPEERGSVLSAHHDFHFTFPQDAAWFTIAFRPNVSAESSHLVGDYFTLTNVMLCEGNLINPAWYPSDSDLYRTQRIMERVDIIERNRINETVEKLMQMRRKTRIRTSQRTFGNRPLILIHFSDIHGDVENMKNVIAFAERYAASGLIDDVLHTGDSVKIRSDDKTFDGLKQVPGFEKVLNCIGNHDSRTNDGWTGLGVGKCYDTYFGPFKENWGGVVFGTDSSGENCTWYYKDYYQNSNADPDEQDDQGEQEEDQSSMDMDAAGMRLIVLDIMHQDVILEENSPQLVWFKSVLADAKSKKLHVMAAAHARAWCQLDPIDTAWDDYKGGVYRAAQDDSSGNGYNSETGEHDNTGFPANLAEAYSKAVDSFIGAGGKFICWLHGHTHYRIFARLSGHQRQLNVAVANAGGEDNCKTSVWGKKPYTKTQDDFNVIAVDTTACILRIMKVGVSYDRLMRKADTISYNYKTGEVLWGAGPKETMTQQSELIISAMQSLKEIFEEKEPEAAAILDQLVLDLAELS